MPLFSESSQVKQCPFEDMNPKRQRHIQTSGELWLYKAVVLTFFGQFQKFLLIMTLTY